MTSLAAPSPGFGLGLRPAHYAGFLGEPVRVDWLEIITDNYLVPGGKPLAMLDAIRARYPMAMHGVSLGLGSVRGLDRDYLRALADLARRVEPLWISDHLCWTGVHGRHLHDLLPLPYTEEALEVVTRNIGVAQDALGRRLVIENVSSYVEFAGSRLGEAEFVREVCERADCLLLLDLNNVHVSAVNHGFDAHAYLREMPARRIHLFHPATHNNYALPLLDTLPNWSGVAVGEFFREACERFGPVATMIERDDVIPPLCELVGELDRARRVAAECLPDTTAGSLARAA